jgi:hypothetical protein
MNTSIVQQIELSEIKQLIVAVVNQIIRGLYVFSVLIYTKIANWYLKVGEDFAFKNIEKQGLVNILYERASRFFGIKDHDASDAIKSIRTKKRRVMVKKTTLLPFYLLITLLSNMKNRTEKEKSCQKMNKKVNFYQPRNNT